LQNPLRALRQAASALNLPLLEEVTDIDVLLAQWTDLWRVQHAPRAPFKA
jgi:hypothetical protein